MAKKIIAVVVVVILVIGISVGTTLLVDKNAVPASTTIENGCRHMNLLRNTVTRNCTRVVNIS